MRNSGKASSPGAPVASATAKTAARPAYGVARWTSPRVLEGMTSGRGRPGNTPCASPPLLVATALGALLVLAPLVPFEAPSVGRLASAVPVLLGLGLALYPLWGSGSVVGIVISGILAALGAGLILLPWERIPRPLHAISPIG